jgi:hypothetical protein
MNNEKHREEYAKLKDGIMITENAISDCRGRIVRLESDINDKRATIAEIKAKLEVEDRVIASPSRLHKPTMTAEQYLAHQGNIEMIEDQLPELNTNLEYQSRSLALLDSELKDKRSALKYTRELLVTDLVEKSASECSEVASKELKTLVMAIIAASGKQKGYTFTEQTYFDQATHKLICEKILESIFGSKELPELQESNQYVNAILEAA